MADVRWRKDVGAAQITKISVGPMDNNVYVIAVGGEVLLVDGSNEAQAILDEIGDRNLAAVIQTHGHGDHVVALPELVAATGAPVFCHDDDSPRMPVAVEPLSADGDFHAFGGLSIKVMHTPGHTPGSICLLLEEAGESHLFSGDTLFPGGPGGTFGDTKAFETIMRSLDEKVFSLPDETFVYPGHGDDTTIGAERPHLDEWRERGW